MINILSGIQNTSSALAAERVRMEVIAQNIANADTTRGPDGKPFQRQQVVFESVLKGQLAAGAEGQPRGVQVARIVTDSRPPRLVFNPGHPDANAQGMVAMPNVEVPLEMVDLIAASRAFEANLAVAKNARAMAMQTLTLGKH